MIVDPISSLPFPAHSVRYDFHPNSVVAVVPHFSILALPALRLLPPDSFAPRPHVVESHQINLLASTVLRHLQQIQHTQKSRLPRQLRRNVREPDRLNRIDFDCPFSHPVSRANSHVRPHPAPHAARNSPSPDAFAQPLRTHPGLRLLPSVRLQTRS